ncbi:MAG: hypothetical protein ACFFAO_07600 [Candidatus Hermodarchaeota archaeon]
MTERLEGKVSEIINEYVVAINIGKNLGVTKGMIFDIVSPKVAIIDPDTKQELGEYEHVKARVEVVSVYDKFSLARNSEQITNIFWPLTMSRRKILPVAYTKVNMEIEIGDGVRQYVKETYVKCDHCGNEFKSPIQVANIENAKVEGNITICPHCNKETPIENRNIFNI